MTGATTIALGATGPILGATDSDGVRWRLDVGGFTGWGSPASTLEPVQKPRQAGAWAGDAFDGGRSIVANGTITAPTPQLLNNAIDKLKAAVSNSEFMMTVTETDHSRWVLARKQGETLTPKLTQLIGQYSIQVFAEDPRQFGTALTGSTNLPVSAGGMTLPVTVPFPILATSVSGQVILVNPGNETGPAVLRVDGPCVGPIITHVGSQLALTFSSSLVLGVGEFLLIDMEARTVLANGQSSRSGYITSRGWSGFEPGANVWSFTAASYNAASLLTVTATPANK